MSTGALGWGTPSDSSFSVRSNLRTLNEELFRIGIVWQGNPDNKRDRWRSVPLEKFAPLAKIPGVSLISLQTGPAREELLARPGIAVDMAVDLTETAAIMKNLDLVISVDTAPAHLAGALGVPTWIVLARVADWRWLLERSDSPWYPSVRLFRQARWHDWEEVFSRIKAALEQRPAKPQLAKQEFEKE